MAVESWSATPGVNRFSRRGAGDLRPTSRSRRGVWLPGGFADLGWARRPDLFVDSSATKAETRHVEFWGRYLRAQPAVHSGIRKTHCDRNQAHALAKPEASGTSKTFSGQHHCARIVTAEAARPPPRRVCARRHTICARAAMHESMWVAMHAACRWLAWRVSAYQYLLMRLCLKG